MTSTVSAASPNGRRKIPSTTRTARTRPTGTVASLRWTTPRRIRSRSASRITVKPPNATTAPTVESSQASSTMPITASTITIVECGSERTASSPWRSLNSCWSTCPAPASTGTTIPSWPAVNAAIARSRPASRRDGPTGSSPTGSREVACGRAARSSSTAPGASAGSAISPPFLPAPVWMSTEKTPNARCSGPWWTSIAWIRSSRTSVTFFDSAPVT